MGQPKGHEEAVIPSSPQERSVHRPGGLRVQPGWKKRSRPVRSGGPPWVAVVTSGSKEELQPRNKGLGPSACSEDSEELVQAANTLASEDVAATSEGGSSSSGSLTIRAVLATLKRGPSGRMMTAAESEQE